MGHVPHRLYRMDVCFFARQSSNQHLVEDDWNQDVSVGSWSMRGREFKIQWFDSDVFDE